MEAIAGIVQTLRTVPSTHSWWEQLKQWVRDLLLTRVPAVLQRDIYATAALLGALVMVTGRRLGLSAGWAAALGLAACFTLRMVAVWQHWQLPGAR